MIILTIRTDNPEAEIGLFKDGKELVYEKWPAHRQLAESLHLKITKNLQKIDKNWSDIKAVVVFKGPGSFTGLRIGSSVGNALADGLKIPIVGTQKNDWIQNGIELLKKGQNTKIVLPNYGAPAKTTTPRLSTDRPAA